MNSEELEQSLRSEFETYMKGVLDRMCDETREFKNKIEAEFEKHKANTDEAFAAFAGSFDSDVDLDEPTLGSLAEHLRLARDEGAKIAAMAMAEAEKLAEETRPEPQPSAAPPRYDAIRDAVNDISAKDSQSAILKSLVHHAEQFAPRGAFFIIKNEHFVGWKVFGDAGDAESEVRDIHFPTSADTMLGRAVHELSAVEDATSEADFAFLAPLNFGQPQNAVAVPLMARGRGVAVLYADGGHGNTDVNREALETITRVAGMTVELLASTGAVRDDERESVDSTDEAPPEQHAHDTSEAATEPAASFEPPADYPASFTQEHQADQTFSYGDIDQSSASEAAQPYQEPAEEVSSLHDVQSTHEAEPQFAAPFDEPQAEASSHAHEIYHDETPQPSFETEPESEVVAPPNESEAAADYSFGEPQIDHEIASPFDAPEAEYERTTGAGDSGGAMVFESGGSIEPAAVQASPFEQPVTQFEPAAAVNSFSKAVEPVPESRTMSSMPQSRLSDRNVDLPIDVPEEERRLHNDARRFARLLVSEIKLYNEKKVLEGRQAHDLYDRLREAVDRSREMYDKRVQPPVAAKFDYFHYELVNSLAEGNVERLGSDYPGATV